MVGRYSDNVAHMNGAHSTSHIASYGASSNSQHSNKKNVQLRHLSIQIEE